MTIHHLADPAANTLGPKYVAPCSVFRLTPDETVYKLVAQALRDERQSETQQPEPPEPEQLTLW